MLRLYLYARVRVLCTYCTRDRGCSKHPAFPAPSVGREIYVCLGRTAPREGERMVDHRHCERSEAIHLAAQRKNGLLRCARNDVDKSVPPQLSSSANGSAECAPDDRLRRAIQMLWGEKRRRGRPSGAVITQGSLPCRNRLTPASPSPPSSRIAHWSR